MSSMAPLTIPTLPDGVDTLTAALDYAKSGWYVLPTDPKVDIKHPGSLVGSHWQDKSSRDPKQIAAWFAGTDYGLVLHCGRSGALLFDVDAPTLLPDVVRPHLATAPYQPTRPDTPDRGHYPFLMPPGRTIGNSGGRLGGAWGEVRGANGVIVVTPTPHKDGGRYGPWQRAGVVPPLPDEIAAKLDDATPACDAASDAAVNAFIAQHTAASRPTILAGWTKALGNHFAAHASRHQSTVTVLVGALKEARAGYLSAQVAIDAIRSPFLAEVAKPPGSKHQSAARNGTVASAEFHGILAWAVGQADAADLDEVRARVQAQMPHAVDWTSFVCANGQAPKNAHAGFWDATEPLRRIQGWARHRRVGPWATLGAAMARVTSTVGPSAQIYPYTGHVGSLNLFVGLVGPSGSGKGGAEGAAVAALRTGAIYATGPGSGEGINHLFAHYDKNDATNGGNGTVFHRHEVYFSVREVDTLISLGSRSGSTLLAQLCKAWSGEDLTFAYADQTKALIIPEHSYRLCMVVGIQPDRAGALLDATDTGVPQRFLWLPVDDPDMPDLRPPAPERVDCVNVSRYSPTSEVQLPPAAAWQLDRHQVLKNRGQSTDSELDGHLGLSRLKVACALALLHGHDKYQLTQEHWDLAGEVMAVSTQTRDRVQSYRNARGLEEERTRGKREGIRAAAAEAVTTDEAVKRVARGVVRYLNTHGATMRGIVRKRGVDSRDRGYFNAAVERLVAAGQLEIVNQGANDLLRLVIP